VGGDGAHAEFLKLPAVNLLPVPDEISDQRAVFTEPLAAAYGILERTSITKTQESPSSATANSAAVRASLWPDRRAVVLVVKHQGKLQIAAPRP